VGVQPNYYCLIHRVRNLPIIKIDVIAGSWTSFVTAKRGVGEKREKKALCGHGYSGQGGSQGKGLSRHRGKGLSAHRGEDRNA